MFCFFFDIHRLPRFTLTATLFPYTTRVRAIAAGALMLIVALIVATLAHAAVGWWGVAVVAAFVLAAIFGKDPPTEPTSPRRKRKGLHLNDDPNPWYMQSQYRFGSGNSAAHNRWHK